MRYNIWCTLVVLLIIGSLLVVPMSIRAADTGTKTSPSFSTGQTYTTTLANVLKGEILQWSWSSSSSLSFSIISPSGVVYSKGANGVIVSPETGTWSFRWTNNNWLFEATVTYRVFSVIITPSIDYPSDGASIHTRNVHITGTCYPNLDWIRYSYDNITYQQLETRDVNWATNLTLIEEQNTIYLMYQYSYVDTIVGYYEISYNVDTIIPTVDNPHAESTINSRKPHVTGTCIPDMSQIYYSYDNINFQPVEQSDTTWGCDFSLSEGQNTVYFTYGFAYGTISESFELSYNVDTYWINDDGFLGLGNGSWMIIISIIVLVIVISVFFYVFKRQRTKLI